MQKTQRTISLACIMWVMALTLSAGPAAAIDWPQTWHVFGTWHADPENLGALEIDIADLVEIPAVITTNGETHNRREVRSDDGHFDLGALFGGFQTYDVAYAFAVIDSPEALEIDIGAGADWWMQWWVNGAAVGDTLAGGNGAWPLRVTNHVFKASLQPGKNIVAVRVISGSNSFTLRAGGTEEVRRELELDNTWPAAPIAVSPAEAVIESFWVTGLGAPTRWQVQGGQLTAAWDACFCNIPVGPDGGSAALTRNYRIDLGGYQRLRVRLRPGAGVTTTIIAEVDGHAQQVAQETAAGNDEIELVGPISGKTLTRLALRFAVPPDSAALPAGNEPTASPQTHGVLLRWVMLENDAPAWSPPPEPFAGMIVDEPVADFTPGLGLLFGAEELEQMRQAYAAPMFASLWREDLQRAAEQFAVDPATMIRPYVLYDPRRYGRTADMAIDTGNDGLLLALVGLITRNEDYLRQAARHAVVFALIDEWAEGFVDRFPEGNWDHAGFAPNVATIKAALLLDWTWHWLTAEARDLIRNAIREKGLHWLQGREDRMANQGVRFTKGLVLGNIAVAEDRADPALRAALQDYIDKLNHKVATVARPDGTFSEGMAYGQGTMASLPITYVAAARCLDKPVRELVSERFLPAMRFILTAERRIAPSFAAFAAGTLGDELFADQCVPTSVMASHAGPHYNNTSGNRCEYVFYGLIPVWAPQVLPEPVAPRLPEFALFPDGGWLYLGNTEPAAPRVSFESGLWDGQGHSWYHTHALTLEAWGQQLLISRQHLPYADARSRYTMSTRLYNTFAPTGRDQDASGVPGRGALLTVAQDLGPAALVESDNATAWQNNVTRALRRVLFLRPSVIIVQDVVELENPETGVQSWNSLQPWQTTEGRMYITRVGDAAARLTCLSPQSLDLTAGSESVHRLADNSQVPVYRAAFTAPSARRHHLLTIIETWSGDDEQNARVAVLDAEQRLVEIHQGDVVVRVMPGPVEGDELWGCVADGELAFAIRENDQLTFAGAFSATSLETPIGRGEGEDFLLVRDH